MRKTAAYALGFTALFLSIVSVMVGAPTLFYMMTAVIAMILGARLQAWLSVQGLEIQRIAPSTVQVGEIVQVEFKVKCNSKLKRPLIMLFDALPKRMNVVDLSPCLPVAPSSEGSVYSQYQFRPQRRGAFLWSGTTAVGIDALGIALSKKTYRTNTSQLLVLPIPLPLGLDIPKNGRAGIATEGSGQVKGGQEPRGVRDYVRGDSLRHIHWRSSARLGKLLVKEFEGGGMGATAFLIQSTKGTDFGSGNMSSLDYMCGHALYCALEFRRRGIEPDFPQYEDPQREYGSSRNQEISLLLANILPIREVSIETDLLRIKNESRIGSVYLFLSSRVELLPSIISECVSDGIQITIILYDISKLSGSSYSIEKRNTVDPEYVELLQSSGAEIVLSTSSTIDVYKTNDNKYADDYSPFTNEKATVKGGV